MKNYCFRIRDIAGRRFETLWAGWNRNIFW